MSQPWYMQPLRNYATGSVDLNASGGAQMSLPGQVVSALSGIDSSQIIDAKRDNRNRKENEKAIAGYSPGELTGYDPEVRGSGAAAVRSFLDTKEEKRGDKSHTRTMEGITEQLKPQSEQVAATLEIGKKQLTEATNSRIDSNEFLRQQLLQQSIDSARDSQTSLQLAQMNNEATLRAHEMDMEMYDRDSTREAYSGIGLGLAGLAAMLAA